MKAEVYATIGSPADIPRKICTVEDADSELVLRRAFDYAHARFAQGDIREHLTVVVYLDGADGNWLRLCRLSGLIPAEARDAT